MIALHDRVELDVVRLVVLADAARLHQVGVPRHGHELQLYVEPVLDLRGRNRKWEVAGALSYSLPKGNKRAPATCYLLLIPGGRMRSVNKQQKR